MDQRIKFKEITIWIKDMIHDYRHPVNNIDRPTHKQKRQAYLRSLRVLFINIWNGLSAPIMYPIWYVFRKKITTEIYRDTTWQEINGLIQLNRITTVKNILQQQGKFLYWLWTYGDLRDPLGEGELINLGQKNNFWNRYKENAFRNPRFTTNFLEFRTETIEEVIVAKDTRDFHLMHKSEGIGDSPDGIYFKWMKDVFGKWYFIYENNNRNCIFYYGYTGLLRDDIGNNGRFETAYRKTDSSYTK